MQFKEVEQHPPSDFSICPDQQIYQAHETTGVADDNNFRGRLGGICT